MMQVSSLRLTVIGLIAFLSGCGSGIAHTGSTILDGQVTVCTDNRLVEGGQGHDDWGRAISPRLEDFEAIITPQGRTLVERSQSDIGPVGDAMNIPFCRDKIPEKSTPYGTSGTPKDKKSEAQRKAYKAWIDSHLDTDFRASDTLYVVDGQVRHINILAIKVNR